MKRNYVYPISLIGVILVIVWSIANRDSFISVSNKLYDIIIVNAGWLYLLLIAGFVVFCIALAFSRYGDIRLGKDNEEPEYSTVSWFAMLFCAGMGVGLVFWGVSEPLSHFLFPDNMGGGTPEAFDFAIRSTFMHWGIHPWAIYAVIGLSIAYFSFRKGEKNLISSSFIPIVGRKRVEGMFGNAIDILTVFITVIGIATSLGLGAMQINGGLSYLTGIGYTLKSQIIIIATVTVFYTMSSVSGVDRGIKILSNFNLILFIGLAVIAFVAGPKVEILNGFVNGMGEYISA